MKLKPNIVFARIKFFIFFLCTSIAGVHAQTTDLSVRFLGQPPDRVAIGEAFAIQAEVFHADGASLPVVGETITATLDLIRSERYCNIHLCAELEWISQPGPGCNRRA